MSGWVPMDIKTNILEMMARQQGVDLPSEVFNRPSQQQDDQETAAAPAASSSSRSSLSSTSRALSSDLRSCVDVDAPLISTRRKVIPKSPEKPKKKKHQTPGDEEDEFLYDSSHTGPPGVGEGDDDAAAIVDPTGAVTPVLAPAAAGPQYRGSQYLDEPLDPLDEPVDEPVSAPVSMVSEASGSIGTEALEVVVLHSTTAKPAPEVIPLLDDDDEDDVVIDYNDEVEDVKKPVVSESWQCDIPGLGSPIPPEEQHQDPVIDSVCEFEQEQEDPAVAAAVDGDHHQENPEEDEQQQVQEEEREEEERDHDEEREEDVAMEQDLEPEPDQHLDNDNNETVQEALNEGMESSDASAFSMAMSMFSSPSVDPQPAVTDTDVTMNEAPAETEAPVSPAVDCNASTKETSVSLAAAEIVTEPESTARITRSSSRIALSNNNSPSPTKAASISSGPQKITPVKIKIVPIANSPSGIMYQVKSNDPQVMKVVIKKTASKTNDQPTSHPIIVEHKSPSSSSASGKQSVRKASPPGGKRKKITPAAPTPTTTAAVVDQQPLQSSMTAVTSLPIASTPDPCLNCGRPAVINKLWDKEYCSHQCVFFYVKKVFNEMYPAKDTKIKNRSEVTSASVDAMS